jgi:hypothetical protein
VSDAVTVTIPEVLVRQCAMLGVERWMAKKDSTDKPSYAQGTPQQEVRARPSQLGTSQHL